MKCFFALTICALVFLSCDTNDSELANSNSYDHQAGEKHNELVIDFLNDQTRGAVIDPVSVFDWASAVDDVDLTKTDSYIFDSPGSNAVYSSSNSRRLSTHEVLDTYERFDPRVYLEKFETENSEYFNVLLMAIMDLTDSASSNPIEMASVITDFSEGITIDSLLDDKEKNILLTSLDVYYSSLELWTSVDSLMKVENPDGRILWGPEDYWKVPVNDWIGGIAGAIMAGPAAPVGALVGGVSSSLMTWIGGQYRSSTPYNLRNLSVNKINRVSIDRGLIKRRAYYQNTRLNYVKLKYGK